MKREEKLEKTLGEIYALVSVSAIDADTKEKIKGIVSNALATKPKPMPQSSKVTSAISIQ